MENSIKMDQPKLLCSTQKYIFTLRISRIPSHFSSVHCAAYNMQTHTNQIINLQHHKMCTENLEAHQSSQQIL